jgi:methylglyoxal reductase
MRFARLGRTDRDVSVVVFGGMTLGGRGGRGSDDQRMATIRAALDAGITAIDTAPIYDFGRSERLVGRALSDRRDRVRVLTKVGLRWDDPRGKPLFPFRDPEAGEGWVHINSRPDSIRVEVDRSLERLGVDVLDLVQVHHPDEETPIEETIGALLDLKNAGKLRAIGVSNYSAEQIARAQRTLGDVPLASVQSEYSLLERRVETDVLPAARATGAAFLCYSPLARGLLSGTAHARSYNIDDFRSHAPLFAKSNRTRVGDVVELVMQPMADRYRITVPQLALAWLLAQPGVTAVIASARTPAQARQNAGAANIRLDPVDVAALATAFTGVVLDRTDRDGNVRKVERRVRKVFARARSLVMRQIGLDRS